MKRDIPASSHTSACLTCGAPCKNKFCSISCSSKYWNPKTKTGKFRDGAIGRQVVTLDLVCVKCGKAFSVSRERRKLHGKNVPSHCSRTCANSRNHSEYTKQRISASVSRAHPPKSRPPLKPRLTRKLSTCKHCGKECPRPNMTFCSTSCHNAYRRSAVLTDLLSGTYAGRVLDLGTVKLALIQLRGHVCAICGLSEWRGQPIPLVLDHIDGRASNNVPDNLRLVCANCDRQLNTFGSRNKNSDRQQRREWRSRKRAQGIDPG